MEKGVRADLEGSYPHSKDEFFDREFFDRLDMVKNAMFSRVDIMTALKNTANTAQGKTS